MQEKTVYRLEQFQNAKSRKLEDIIKELTDGRTNDQKKLGSEYLHKKDILAKFDSLDILILKNDIETNKNIKKIDKTIDNL